MSLANIRITIEQGSSKAKGSRKYIGRNASLSLVVFKIVQDVNLFLEVKTLAINKLDYFVHVEAFNSV